MRAAKRFSCSSLPTSSQILIRLMPPSTMYFSISGQSSRKRSVLLLGAEAHDVFDAGAVVPAAVEDHDLAGGREVLDVALHVHLRLLAVGRRRQRDDAEDARADPLGDRLDRAALAGGVAALEDDDDAQALGLDPFLQVAELDLQLAKLLLVDLALDLFAVQRSPCCSCMSPWPPADCRPSPRSVPTQRDADVAGHAVREIDDLVFELVAARLQMLPPER